jgi:hypothetical protein
MSARAGTAVAFACATLASLAPCLGGCAGDLEVTRLMTVQDAIQLHSSRLVPVAVTRDGERIPIGAGATMTPKEIRWEARGQFSHTLEEGDVVLTDDHDRITGLRTRAGVTYNFAPGTAKSPENSDKITGALAGEPKIVQLLPRDKIVLEGTFAPDENVPGGGHIETKRSTELLVLGLLVFGLGYAPAVYVGATSSLNSDRALLVPALGPWIDLATRPKCVPPPGSEILPVDPCSVETASKVGVIAAGVVQALGTVLIAFGLPSHSVFVRDSIAKNKPWWQLVPTTMQGGGGAAVVGAF